MSLCPGSSLFALAWISHHVCTVSSPATSRPNGGGEGPTPLFIACQADHAAVITELLGSPGGTPKGSASASSPHHRDLVYLWVGGGRNFHCWLVPFFGLGADFISPPPRPPSGGGWADLGGGEKLFGTVKARPSASWNCVYLGRGQTSSSVNTLPQIPPPSHRIIAPLQWLGCNFLGSLGF